MSNFSRVGYIAKVIEAGPEPFTMVINAHSLQVLHSLHQPSLHLPHTADRPTLPSLAPGHLGVEEH